MVARGGRGCDVARPTGASTPMRSTAREVGSGQGAVTVSRRCLQAQPCSQRGAICANHEVVRDVRADERAHAVAGRTWRITGAGNERYTPNEFAATSPAEQHSRKRCCVRWCWRRPRCWRRRPVLVANEARLGEVIVAVKREDAWPRAGSRSSRTSVGLPTRVEVRP